MGRASTPSAPAVQVTGQPAVLIVSPVTNRSGSPVQEARCRAASMRAPGLRPRPCPRDAAAWRGLAPSCRPALPPRLPGVLPALPPAPDRQWRPAGCQGTGAAASHSAETAACRERSSCGAAQAWTASRGCCGDCSTGPCRASRGCWNTWCPPAASTGGQQWAATMADSSQAKGP